MVEMIYNDIMASKINIHEAKTHFSKLLARVQAGEEIVIAKAGVPLARLVPAAPMPEKRVLGTARGQVWMSDDFDAPLPDDLLKSFFT